ncbi:MAG: biotin--[acetyl-CoA-carboxylase] ligase [Candidatus Woesearchaeota archaeon]
MFKFYYFKTLTSTNDKAKYLAKKGLDKIIVTANKQIKGRGRFNREWASGLGGLYMTLLLKEKDLDRAKYLALIASLAVAKTIKKLGLDAQVKWPNDVLVNDKKICGILAESIFGKEKYALVGIGVNVNQTKFDKKISNTATSLKIESNKNYDLKKIINEITKQFNILYQYYKIKDYKKIISIWKKYSHTIGRKIKVKTLAGAYSGKAIGIDKECNLILRLDNRKLKKIVEGDVFVV